MKFIDNLKMASAVCCSLLALGACNHEVSYTFDSSKEVSGFKVALKDINPDLPTDWTGYNYVVLEYKITTSQRFQLGFTTDWGYNDLRVMSYVPGAWNRLAIPLKYYTELPAPAFDVAATMNKPRYTGWINLGGQRGSLTGVDSVGVRIRKPISNPKIYIRNITLSVDDPGDAYLEKHPAIDRFGQSIYAQYPEKVKSLEDLEKQWREEEAEEVSTERFQYSRFGGYLNSQVEATGFFRTEQIDGKWWFVDPEGHLFLSLGVDCVSPGNGGLVRDYDKRAGMYEAIPPVDEVAPIESRAGMAYSLSAWNQVRRFGKDWKGKANDLIIKRMDKWGMNTIANWSGRDVIELGRKAFMLSFGGIGQDASMMGLADVYSPDFVPTVEKSISSMVAKNVDNPWLIGYFVGNEPAWINDEVRLCQIILDGPDRPIKAALKKYLESNGDTDENRVAFIYDAFDKFLETVDKVYKKYDPHHLNLGMRFANPDTITEALLSICGKHFDVFSFNAYMLAPDKDMLDRAYACTGKPMIVGEYHFGTVDRGLAQALWQTDSEKDRADCYRYYTENAYAHPAFIGSGYFQWSDQDITGRFDGENYNCGLVDVTDRPYKDMVDAMIATAECLYDVHCGTAKPFATYPESARGYELIPDIWE